VEILQNAKKSAGIVLLSSQKSTFARRSLPSSKVWGDRITRAGCRCENVVFFYRQNCREAANCRYCIITGRMPRRGKLPVLFLLTGQKSGFSPRRGDSLHRFKSNLAGPTGTWVCLVALNFTSIGAEGWECGPKYRKFPLFGKESPRRGDSLDRFRKLLGAFIRLSILR